MLSRQLAQKIVEEARLLLREHIIIADVTGIIMASTDPQRVGQFHEGAQLCVRRVDTVIIAKEDERKLRGVRAGINLPLLFHGRVIGVLGITGEPAVIAPFGELLRKMTELLIRENYYTEQLELEQRTYESFVLDWLHGGEKEDSGFADRAKALGIPDGQRVRLALIVMDKDDTAVQRQIWQYMQSRLDRQHHLLVRWGNDRLMLIRFAMSEGRKELTPQLERFRSDCRERFRTDVRIGVGRWVEPSELPLSYEQAVKAARAAANGPGIVYHEDLRLEMCLQDVTARTKEEYTARTIGALREHRELYATLKAFISCDLSYKMTANTLNIHINSLHYRLGKIEDITGLSPKKFTDMAELYVAVLLLDE